MLSEYDRENVGAIIHEGLGDWYSARLLRAIHDLYPHADSENRARLEVAFPEEVAAYIDWFWNQS